MEICEAYSGTCLIPPVVVDRDPAAYPFDIPMETGTATSTPKGPAELPLTGVTYGDILSVGLILVLVGVLLMLAVKKFF